MFHKIKRKIETLIKLIRGKKFKRLIRLIYLEFLFMIYRILPHSGVKVVEEDWDYLIVLDACRYDIFKELNTIPGKLEKKISLGSSTLEWLKKNFTEFYEDIVYVSANPYISNVEIKGFRITDRSLSFRGADHFFKVEKVWEYGWDERLNTVPPKIVTEAALRMKRKYPNKRMIIHYLQPHAPWIGETRISSRELNRSNPSTRNDVWGNFVAGGKIWELIEEGVISLEFAKRAYRDNLRLVLNEVKKLVENLEGKIVITADHGECFGEKFIFEHPAGIYIKELVEIPWLVIEKPKRIETLEKRKIKNVVYKLKSKGKNINILNKILL